MHGPRLYSSGSARPWFSDRRWFLVGVATLTLSLAPSPGVEAQGPNLTGRWTPPSDTLGHMSVHMALLRGDANHHSKLLSWEFKDGGTGKLWGWNPSDTSTCTIYPASQFQVLPLGHDVPETTLFRFDLPQRESVSLEVMDIQGRRIDRVTHGTYPAGQHTIEWAPGMKSIRPGVYWYRIVAGSFRAERKLILLP